MSSDSGDELTQQRRLAYATDKLSRISIALDAAFEGLGQLEKTRLNYAEYSEHVERRISEIGGRTKTLLDALEHYDANVHARLFASEIP